MNFFKNLKDSTHYSNLDFCILLRLEFETNVFDDHVIGQKRDVTHLSDI